VTPSLAPLPIDAAIDDIRAALVRHRAVVVVAEPGAGKTTRVPPALLDAGKAIVLQPRRAAARAIARRIADERGWTIGREVGWQVRFVRRFQPDTRLLVATEGVLTARLQHDPLLSDFATIVLDEFHERSMHADLAIALAREALRARDDLRLVVMSATMDAKRVAEYLRCESIAVAGRAHPVRVTCDPHADIVDAALRAMHETAGTVLCFQPGAREIERTIAALHERQVGRQAEILPLHGSLPVERQDVALTPARAGRRIIVCTNLAETSVTVPDVTAVVDSGLEKIARYDPGRAIDSLRVERISQAAADQRAGRAGRTAPGFVVRLWSAADRLKPYRDPEIHRVDLSGVVLDVAGWGGDARTLDWFEVPRRDAIEAAITLLNRMGALDGAVVTPTGAAMLRLPLPPRLARIVVESGGHRDAVRAVSLLAEPHGFTWPDASTSSDLLSALDRWTDVPPHVREYADQLQHAATSSAGGATRLDERELRRAILAGYPDRVAQRRSPGSPRFLLGTGSGAVLSNQSGVRSGEFIVALDVQASVDRTESESRIRLASAVEAEWLEPTSSEREYLVDEGAVRAVEVTRYDALVLQRHPVAGDPERMADLLAEAWLSRARSDADTSLLNRLRFAGIAIELRPLLKRAAFGKRSADEIVLADALAFEVLRQLEREAPPTILLPSGRHASLDYADDGSVAASIKLQELFGLAQTPLIGGRREPLLLRLLAPNGRPVQVTRDLRSFWTRTYPEVRKELRGRYPKHPWPDDPWTAMPTHRTRPRSGGR
jgi:ATP-dependent helicase HrpB